MNELLRELEEDIRNERLERLWNSFGKLIMAASVAVIVVTVIVVVWQNRKHEYATTQTSQFIKGLDRFKVEDYSGALEVFTDLAADEQSPYYGIAMLHKAKAHRLHNDIEAARKTYQALAEHSSNESNKTFTELARILAADSADKLIDPPKDSPFFYTQTDWRAWQLMQKGDKQEAIGIFTALRDDEHTPPSQRERVKQVLEHLGVETPPAKVEAPANE